MSQPYIDFAFVKENASFARVLEHYNLTSRGSGAQRSLCCPFHPDKKPSCRVELDKKIWHCFACEAKGNVLEFVARLEGDKDDLRAAAVKIAEICGIGTAASREPAAKSSRSAARKGRHEKIASKREPAAAPGLRAPVRAPAEDAETDLTNRNTRGVAKKVAEAKAGATEPAAPANPPLTFQLKLDPEHPYLAERGLSAGLVATFGLGHCTRGVMAGRICIPIHDGAGQLVAYAGRWPGEPPEGVERYLLPKRFEKSRVLFNLHRVAPGEHIVLVEGYWSALRLHALGVPVVALMGSSVSAAQIALLRDRGTRHVTLLLDGDDAGRKARERALPDLANTFFVRAPILPDGEKPDTLSEAELLELVAPP